MQEMAKYSLKDAGLVRRLKGEFRSKNMGLRSEWGNVKYAVEESKYVEAYFAEQQKQQQTGQPRQ